MEKQILLTSLFMLIVGSFIIVSVPKYSNIIGVIVLATFVTLPIVYDGPKRTDEVKEK